MIIIILSLLGVSVLLNVLAFRDSSSQGDRYFDDIARRMDAFQPGWHITNEKIDDLELRLTMILEDIKKK